MYRELVRWTLVTLCLLSIGCVRDPVTAPPLESCTKTSDCPANFTCVNLQCTPSDTEPADVAQPVDVARTTDSAPPTDVEPAPDETEPPNDTGPPEIDVTDTGPEPEDVTVDSTTEDGTDTAPPVDAPICVPDCTEKSCGDDGCGGSCGACEGCDGPDAALCAGGTCESVCCPDCDGKSCGDDGCGGVCGVCSADSACEGNLCAAKGACCVNDGACTFVSSTGCTVLSGTWTEDAECTVVECAPLDKGACCLADACSALDEATCISQGGAFLGVDSPCWECASNCCAKDLSCTPGFGAATCITVNGVPQLNSCAEGCSRLIINEFDYDQPGADSMQFIEILNTGNGAAPLTDVSLELVNGGGGTDTVYAVIDLGAAGGSLLPGEYLVVGDAGVVAALPGTTKSVTLEIGPQNGKSDGLRLKRTDMIVDSVAYEGAMATVGEGAWLSGDNASPSAYARCPDGVDTNDNASDFALSPTPTPGAANDCDDLPVSFTDVHPIFKSKCGGCHTVGSSGSHSIGSSDTNEAYADSQKPSYYTGTGSKGGAALIRVKDGTMPQGAGCSGDPGADAGNAKCLTADEQALLQAWTDGGQPGP